MTVKLIETTQPLRVKTHGYIIDNQTETGESITRRGSSTIFPIALYPRPTSHEASVPETSQSMLCGRCRCHARADDLFVGLNMLKGARVKWGVDLPRLALVDTWSGTSRLWRGRDFFPITLVDA